MVSWIGAPNPATIEVEALRNHRRRQAEGHELTQIGDDNDLVFTWPDGRIVVPS